MSAFSIALTVNVILMVALLSVIFKPKVISYYRNKKINREKREVTRIQTIVRDYLKELSND